MLDGQSLGADDQQEVIKRDKLSVSFLLLSLLNRILNTILQ